MWKALRKRITDWLEWLDAKAWAKEFHPSWVDFATKAKHEEVRKLYREMILKYYRGENDET
jgi:hypothetical protein